MMASFTACLTSIAPDVLAQGSGATAGRALTEIVVTARKREETLIAASLSVQALSEVELQEAGLENLYDLQTVAGFTFTQTAGTAAAGTSSCLVRAALNRLRSARSPGVRRVGDSGDG